MTAAKHIGMVMASALAAAGLDQATKWLILTQVMAPPRIIEITPFFNLRLGFNYGVSFGMGRDLLGFWPNALAVFKLAVAAGLLAWAMRTSSRPEQIGLALIAGGAIGNGLDRWWRGAVTDFLDLHWRGWHWPTFNGADIAISLGVALMMLSAWADRGRDHMEPSRTQSGRTGAREDVT